MQCQHIRLIATEARIPDAGLNQLSGRVARGEKNPLFVGMSRRLFHAREQTDLSASRVALEAGLSINTVRKIEDGNIPTLDTLERICAVIGISPAWVAYGHEGYELFKLRRPRDAFPAKDPRPTEKMRVFLNRAAGCAGRIAAARERATLSLRKLAEDAGVSVQTLVRIESNANIPRVDTLEAVALALHVAPSWLAYGDAVDPT